MPKLAEGLDHLDQVFPALRPMRFLKQSALLESLLTTMLVGHDQAHLSQPWVSARTIPIASTDVSVLDFDISRGRLDALYERGYAAARHFLDTWDWQAYLDRFR
jgi:NTE family protein